MTVYREIVTQSQRAIQSARQEYEKGYRDIVVLLQAQRDLSAAEQNYATALRDYADAWASLEQAVGGRLRQVTMNNAPAHGGS